MRALHQAWSCRRIIAGVAAVITVALATVACSSSSGSPPARGAAGSATKLDTLRHGVIKVAVEPYAPYTSMDNGKLVGLDADILASAAGKLGLRVVPVVTDFKGMLGSVQSHRVDISIGGIAWSASRQKVGLFTDPAYYSPPAMAVKPGETIKTVSDLEHKAIGTVEGYIWVKAIQEIPGARLHVYQNVPAVLDDLASGRIDVAFLDPLLLIAAEKAGRHVTIQYLQPPTAADVAQHPNYTAFQPYMVAFYIPKQEPLLEQQLSAQMRAMYSNGELSNLIAKYGGDPQQFLKPAPDFAQQRRGVDRPQDWQPPSS
jgi:polar amino acid transport system substrate-binding protein